MELKDVAGLYGAALSSYLAFRQWQIGRRRLRITSAPAYNGPDHPPAGLHLRVNLANHGTKPVYVRQAFLQVRLSGATWKDRLQHVVSYRRHWAAGERVSMALPPTALIYPELPAVIDPGRSMVIWIPAADYWAAITGPRATGAHLAIQDEMDRTLISSLLADAPRTQSK